MQACAEGLVQAERVRAARRNLLENCMYVDDGFSRQTFSTLIGNILQHQHRSSLDLLRCFQRHQCAGWTGIDDDGRH